MAVQDLGFSYNQSRRLASLPWMLERGSFGEYPQDVVARALQLCNVIPAFEGASWSTDILQALTSVSGIDPGEVQLLSHLVMQPQSLLVSGDKRAMRTLCRKGDLKQIRDAVAGRMIALETLVELLLDKHGIRVVAECFSPIRRMNVALRVIFSEGERTAESACREALKAYLRQLESEVGPDFLFKR